MPVRFGGNDEDDDQEPIMASNSRFDNLRDTLAAFKSPLRASDSTVDTTSEFSEPESSVPELSQAEERAIRLSASQFEPIETQDHQTQGAQTPDHRAQEHQAQEHQAQGSTSMRNYEDVADWQPSPGIQQLIEGETGPKYTRTWDNEGLDIEPEVNTPRVDIIPQQTRERTPDSVMATGMRQIHRPGPSGGAVGFRPPNLQQNGHTNFKPVMRELPDLGATTRGYVGEYNRHNESIELRRDTVRVEDVNIDNVDGRGKVNKQEVGSSFLLPKMVLFVIGLMIILAGIVALIVKFKKNEYEGTGAQILPDPVHRLECPNVTIGLGDDVEFTCTFETFKTHGKRKYLGDYSYSTIEARDRVISEDRLVFNETVNRGDDLQLVFTAVDEGRKARCSTEGGYFINMYDKNDTLLHQANVTIKLESSTIQTTMEQHLDDCPAIGNAEVNTYFETTCSISGDCKSYNPSILRTGGRGNPEPLNHLMECKRNFTDEAGYSLRCTAEIPDTYVTDSSHIRCRMNAEQRRLERTFVLPECPRTDTCLTRDYPFNCSDKGNHIPELKNASCNFQQVKNCLQPGRKIFNLHKNDDGKLFCKNVDRTVPVCRLSWCKDYRYILKDVMPGQLICGSGFIEQEYKPPVTTPSTPKPVTTPSTPKPVTTPVPSR